MRGKTRKLEQEVLSLNERLLFTLEIYIKMANISHNYIISNSDNIGCSICHKMEPEPCNDWCPVGAMSEILSMCEDVIWENNESIKVLLENNNE
jgi:hypothetical protein